MARTKARRRPIADVEGWTHLSEEVAGLGYWRLDPKTRKISWTKGLFRMYGVKDAEPPDLQAAMGAIHPDDAAAANAMLEAAIAAGQGFSAQARVRRPDGSWRTLLNRTTCRRDAAGKVTSVIGVVMDVTEATATDEALRRSEARYRLLADNATDLIVRTDRKGAILYMSPACQSMGWEPEELIGRNCAEQVHPDDLPKLIESGERLWAGQNVVDPELNELRYRTRDGEWRWLQGAPKVIFDEDGRPSEVVNVLRDVTERRRTAAALAEARRLAEAAAEAKAQFLANMSHEIRTPLTAILGFSGLLESLEGLPETAELFVRRIRTAGAQLLSLVNDVLDFSRLEAGQVELDPQPLDLVEFCAETVDLMGAQATAKGLRLELTCGTDIPSLVLADALRLRQVLVNLIGNAIKFTDRGSVRVRLERKAEAIFKVSVLDTGRGIPRRQRSRLFERFSQLDSRTSRGHGGSGLGLAICKALTGLMGGAIGVETPRAGGSRFWFTFQAAEAAAERRLQAPALAPLAGEAAHILIVDDVEINRVLVRAMLEPFGHTFEEARSGVEAVAAATSRPFDLVLMDLQMPGMDGLEAARRIRRKMRCADLPIVALSANVMDEEIAAASAAGMDDHLAKPIVPADLMIVIAKWTARPAPSHRREVA